MTHKTPAAELQAIAAMTGPGSKAAIKTAIAGLSDTALRLIVAALDPYTVYHVKKFPMPKVYAKVDADYEVFFSALEKLSTRAVTGNEAIALSANTMSKYTKDTAELLAKILKKDLKAGFSAETVNEAILGEKRPSNPIVPVYACMLAKKMEDKYKWKFPLILEAKYDGQRCNAYVKNGSVLYFARSGKVMSHVEGLFDAELLALVKSMEEYGIDTSKGVVFDGEAMADNFTLTMNAKGKDNSDAKKALKFIIYEFVPMDVWKSEGVSEIQFNRTRILDTLINENGQSKYKTLRKSRFSIVNSIEEAREEYKSLVDEGFEGAVLKDPNETYKWDRHQAWTKWKPVDTYDLKIVGFYYGKEGGKYETMMGGVHVEGTDENGTVITCDVGSGWSDEQRKYMMENQEEFLGKTIECEADPNLSSKEGRDTLAMRWGVFKKFRPDKD